MSEAAICLITDEPFTVDDSGDGWCHTCGAFHHKDADVRDDEPEDPKPPYVEGWCPCCEVLLTCEIKPGSACSEAETDDILQNMQDEHDRDDPDCGGTLVKETVLS